MPKMGASRERETQSLILVCRARGYNHKQILSVVNDNLRKYNNSLSRERSLLQYYTENKR